MANITKEDKKAIKQTAKAMAETSIESFKKEINSVVNDFIYKYLLYYFTCVDNKTLEPSEAARRCTFHFSKHISRSIDWNDKKVLKDYEKWHKKEYDNDLIKYNDGDVDNNQRQLDE